MNEPHKDAQPQVHIHYTLYHVTLNRNFPILKFYAVSELIFLKQLPSHHAALNQLISETGVLLHEERKGGWNSRRTAQYLSMRNSLQLQPQLFLSYRLLCIHSF